MVFNAPLNENARPGPSLVFPNATHVTAINCRFIIAEDEYYILTSSQPAEFSRGPYIWKNVFPRIAGWTTMQSRHYIALCGIHVQDDQRATSERVGHPFPTNAAHVTVKDIDFIFTKNSNWTIYPGVETILGVNQYYQTENPSSSFYNNVTILSGWFEEITGHFISIGQPHWNETSSEITALQEPALE